ncbi:MAG: glycosyltransferase family 2 protein [Anaerolineales bacterium]
MSSASGSAPSVSVVVGVYNSAPWVREALDSVMEQTRPVSEVVVVDDGSTDKTPEIVKSYGGIVKYVQEAHRGRPHRNTGILAANGEVIAFLDGDDIWAPSKIERQVEILRSKGLFWVTCDARWMEDSTRAIVRNSNAPIQEGDILEPLLLNNFIVASTALVARSVFDEVGLFNESPGVAAVEDWELWLRIAARFPLGCVRQKLCTLRLHGDSFLAALPASERLLHLQTVVEETVRREPARLGPLRHRALANIHYAAGVHAFRQGRLQESRRQFVQVLRNQPSRLGAWAYLVASLFGPALARNIAGTKRRLWPRHG